MSGVSLDVKERINKPLTTLLDHLESASSDTAPSGSSAYASSSQDYYDPFDELLGVAPSQQSHSKSKHSEPGILCDVLAHELYMKHEVMV